MTDIVGITAAPSVQQIEEGVQWALKQKRAGKPVYVHCAHGGQSSYPAEAPSLVCWRPVWQSSLYEHPPSRPRQEEKMISNAYHTLCRPRPVQCDAVCGPGGGGHGLQLHGGARHRAAGAAKGEAQRPAAPGAGRLVCMAGVARQGDVTGSASCSGSVQSLSCVCFTMVSFQGGGQSQQTVHWTEGTSTPAVERDDLIKLRDKSTLTGSAKGTFDWQAQLQFLLRVFLQYVPSHLNLHPSSYLPVQVLPAAFSPPAEHVISFPATLSSIQEELSPNFFATMTTYTVSRCNTASYLSSRVALFLILAITMATSTAAKQTITPVPQVVQAAVSEVSGVWSQHPFSCRLCPKI